MAVDPVRGILTRQESCVVGDKSQEPHKYLFGNVGFSSNCPGCPLFPAGCAIANEVRYPSSDWQGRVSEGSWRDVWSNVSEYVENPARIRRPFFVRMAAGLVNRLGARG